MMGLRSVTYWLVTLVFVGVNAADAAAIDLVAGTEEYDWSGKVAVWHDQTGLATLDDARQATYRPLPGDVNLGFQDGAFWFSGTLRNLDNPQSDWVWHIEYALLDWVDLYLVDDATGIAEHHRSGDHLPFSERLFDHRHFTMPVALPAGQSRQYFLRIQSSSSMQVPARIVTPAQFAENNYRSQLGFGVLYGTFFALIAYNLILYLSMRDLTFLYYVAYVTTFVLFQAVLNGFTFQYLWPNYPGWANTAVTFLMPLIFVAMVQFCRSFLELKRFAPRLDATFLTLMSVFLMLTTLSFFVDYRLMVRVETGLVFVFVTCIIVATIVTIAKGYRPARYLALAWAVLVIGIVLYASVSFGVLEKSFITEFGYQIGSAAEMILLSFALAYRINLLREENVRITAEANQLLEQRVAERTEELNDALQELGEANRTLEAASLRDGLTGAHNRRYLDRALEQLWEQAYEAEQWLGLIVIDLDHFKAVNDERGHLAGDDCLKTLVAAIHSTLGNLPAVLARFGGEEFFILLPDHGIEDARLLAERLRAVIESTPIHSGDEEFFITASFGVAALKPQHDDHQELIQRADDALYEAKRGGRNRVVTAAPKVVG